MKFSPPNSIVSTQDLKSVILEIEKCASWLAQTEIRNRKNSNKSSEAPAISQAADDVIKQWHGDKQVTPKSLDELVEALKEFAKTAPSITITLAAPPPLALKKQLADWCKKNLNPDLLVDFSFNSTMLGGMMVRYNSHVYDWSFKRQILAGRSKFAEVLRHV